jgi:UDP-N-acetyl-D-mannosaminuronic acid transferase (WecB/TagA/CpsF family)
MANIAVDGSLTVGGTSTFGAATNNPVGFFGTTPANQPTSANQAAVISTAAVSISATQFGYATSTQATGIVTLLNQIRADLVTLGLIKGS